MSLLLLLLLGLWLLLLSVCCDAFWQWWQILTWKVHSVLWMINAYWTLLSRHVPGDRGIVCKWGIKKRQWSDEGKICCCCFSVTKSYLTLHPMDCSMPGFPVLHCLSDSLLKFMSIESVMLSSHVMVCRPLSFCLQSFPASGSVTKSLTTACSILLLHLRLLSSVAQSCLTLCDPMDCNMPGFPVHHQLLELAQTHVHWAGDAIQPSHFLSSLSPPAFNPSQQQGLSQGVSSLHQAAKVLEFQLQHQSFQWIFKTSSEFLLMPSW